jgi:hypothetical protein
MVRWHCSFLDMTHQISIVQNGSRAAIDIMRGCGVPGYKIDQRELKSASPASPASRYIESIRSTAKDPR